MKISYRQSFVSKKRSTRNLYIPITMVIVSLLIRFVTIEIRHNNNVVAEAFRIVGEGILEDSSVSDTVYEVFECMAAYPENNKLEVFNNNDEAFKN